MTCQPAAKPNQMKPRTRCLWSFLKAVVSCGFVISCAPVGGDDSTHLNWDGHSCAQMIEDHETAIIHCNLAIESGTLDSENLSATYTNRGWHYSKLGRVNEAIADYSRALEISELSTAYFNRGTLYEAKGDLARAKADFEKAYRMTPNLNSHIEKAKEYGIPTQ